LTTRAPPQEQARGEQQKVSLDEGMLFAADQSAELVAVDEALSRLEKLDPRQCRVVELRSLEANGRRDSRGLEDFAENSGA